MGMIYKHCTYCGGKVYKADSHVTHTWYGRSKWTHTTCLAAAETEKRQAAAEKRQAAAEEKRQAAAERQQAKAAAVVSAPASVAPEPAPPSGLKAMVSGLVAPAADDVQFDLPAEVVFRAAGEGIPTLQGFELVATNPTARPRQLSVTTTASWRSLGLGEKVNISVSEVGPWRTSMRVESTGKLVTAATKNRANVKQIIRAASDQLHQNGAEWTEELGVAAPDANKSESLSIEDRLRRLDALHNEGVINEEDYEAQKHSILSEL